MPIESEFYNAIHNQEKAWLILPYKSKYVQISSGECSSLICQYKQSSILQYMINEKARSLIAWQSKHVNIAQGQMLLLILPLETYFYFAVHN